MKPNELRIGNLVYANNVGTHPSNSYLEPHTIADGKDIENAMWYFPVPISKDALLDFQFVSDNYNVFYITDNKKGTQIGKAELWLHSFSKDGDIIWECFIGAEFGELEFVCLIKHIHQLQNLYYAITGEELTIKTK